MSGSEDGKIYIWDLLEVNIKKIPFKLIFFINYLFFRVIY